MIPAHLVPVETDRGFAHLPPIPVMLGSASLAEALGAGRLPGGDVRVFESSNADSPHIWLVVRETGHSRLDGEEVEACIQLPAEQAWQLKEQIEFLIRNHYQGDARP